MSSAQLVFNTPDIRELIFKKRRYICFEDKFKKIKSIYPKWNIGDNDTIFVNTLPCGKTHRFGTKYVTWSIMKDDNAIVDESPIIVTDNICINNGNVEMMDCLVNDIHLQVKSELWYRENNNNFHILVEDYKQMLLNERRIKMQNEYKRRKYN